MSILWWPYFYIYVFMKHFSLNKYKRKLTMRSLLVSLTNKIQFQKAIPIETCTTFISCFTNILILQSFFILLFSWQWTHVKSVSLWWLDSMFWRILCLACKWTEMFEKNHYALCAHLTTVAPSRGETYMKHSAIVSPLVF